MRDASRQAARGRRGRRAERKLSSQSVFRHTVYLRNLGLVLVSGVVVVVEEGGNVEDEAEAAS